MAAATALSHLHRFEPGSEADRPPILLLHGTGGDENGLLPLGRRVAPGSALLSPRGKVLENGMPRFFRRLAEGVFDEPDVRRRAHELADFVGEARELYGLRAPVALGFSNGANVAAAVLFLRPETLAGAVLLRAMTPLSGNAGADLSGKPVLILSGAEDPIVSSTDAARLATLLRTSGARVEHRTVQAGHGLTGSDAALTKAWIDQHGAIPDEGHR